MSTKSKKLQLCQIFFQYLIWTNYIHLSLSVCVCVCVCAHIFRNSKKNAVIPSKRIMRKYFCYRKERKACESLPSSQKAHPRPTQ
jgi:cbb3-type cytochrome oxidase subunit 3